MSEEQMQLSMELIERLRGALTENDPQAQDPWVACQYLTAVVAYLLATNDLPVDRAELLGRLFGFAKQVMQDITGEEAQAEPSPAFGVWRPGD